MGKEVIMFGDIEVEKHKFHQHKSPISIQGVLQKSIFNTQHLGIGQYPTFSLRKNHQKCTNITP